MAIEADDLFIFAPSFLVEGKAIGSAGHADLELVRNLTSMADFDPKIFAASRKVGQTVGMTHLRDAQTTLESELSAAVRRFDKGKIDAEQLRRLFESAVKTGWKKAFLAGVRASGYAQLGPGGIPILDEMDQTWLKGAMQHEMRFANRFALAVSEGATKMPIPRRIEAYSKSLKSCYESGRVIGLPFNSLVHWVGPNDKVTCESCRYLIELSPFPKHLLPTVPRAGSTLCRFNCRDRLYVRKVSTDQVVEAANGMPTRKQMLDRLRRIMRRGH